MYKIEEKISLYSANEVTIYSSSPDQYSAYLEFMQKAMAILQPDFAPGEDLFDEKKESEPYAYDRITRRLGDSSKGYIVTIQVDEMEARIITFYVETVSIEPYGQNHEISLTIKMTRPPNHSFEECVVECTGTLSYKEDNSLSRGKRKLMAEKEKENSGAVIQLFHQLFNKKDISEKKAEKLAAGLKSKLVRNQFNEAAEAAEGVLQIDTENVDALFSLGIKGALDKDYKAAEAYLQKVIKLQPDHYDAWYNLGIVFIRTEKFTEAEKAFSEGLKIDPDNHPLHYEMAIAEEKLGKKKQAILHYKYAIKLSPNPGGIFGYSGMDFTDKAEAALKRLGSPYDEKEELAVIPTTDLNQDLFRAIESENLKWLKELLKQGADANAADKEYNQPAIYLAARSGNLEMVSSLIDAGADILAKTRGGESVIAAAVSSGNINLVKLLIKAGADINSYDSSGNPILLNACYSPDNGIMDLLLESGADIHLTDNFGTEPFSSLAAFGSLKPMQTFLDRGADINAADRNGITALMRAINMGNADAVNFLMEKKADALQMDNEKRNAFMLAAMNMRHEFIEVLYEACQKQIGSNSFLEIKGYDGYTAFELLKRWGPEYNRPDDYRKTVAFFETIDAVELAPGEAKQFKDTLESANKEADEENQARLNQSLIDAINEDNFEKVKELIDKGASPDAMEYHEMPAINLAIKLDQTQTALFLLDHGADFTIKDQYSNVALHCAADTGDLVVATELLKRGAKVDTGLGEKQTPLMSGAYMADDPIPVSKLLIENGADIHALDQQKCSVLYWACMGKSAAAVEYLISKGAVVNPKNPDEPAPICNAVYLDQTGDMLKILIKHGADLSIRNSDGETLLDIAARADNKVTLKILKENLKGGNPP